MIARGGVLAFWFNKGPSTLRLFLERRGCVFFKFPCQRRENGEYAASNTIASAEWVPASTPLRLLFFCVFCCLMTSTTVRYASLEGNVRCWIILIVEKVLLVIRPFPFYGDRPLCFHGFHCWLLASRSTFSRPPDNHRGSLSSRKLRRLRHHVVGSRRRESSVGDKVLSLSTKIVHLAFTDFGNHTHYSG